MGDSDATTTTTWGKCCDGGIYFLFAFLFYFWNFQQQKVVQENASLKTEIKEVTQTYENEVQRRKQLELELAEVKQKLLGTDICLTQATN